jgi:glycosyltransferase involved in cell wall biosynthesis
MYRLKKKWFTGVDMTLVTPSQWLAELTRESFLKDYPVKVINNGIDLTNFAPTESDLREQYGCRDKKIILGVAFGWGMRKGLDVFKELAGRLDDSYRIILVGTDAHTDVQLPENIISIHRTENQAELAKIYSLADIFVNCTREDTFPTVNIEALACGTPVVTFRTGGSPECIDETCGSVVTYNDVDALEAEILRVCTQKPFDSESCRKRAESFEMHDRFGQYVQLYEEVANR